jgi:hypothetical protein
MERTWKGKDSTAWLLRAACGRHIAACDEALRPAGGLDTVKADNAPKNRSGAADDVIRTKPNTLNPNGLVGLRRNGWRMEEHNV